MKASATNQDAKTLEKAIDGVIADALYELHNSVLFSGRSTWLKDFNRLYNHMHRAKQIVVELMVKSDGKPNVR